MGGASTHWGALQASPQLGVSHSRHLDSGSSERPDISSIKRRIQVLPGALSLLGPSSAPPPWWGGGEGCHPGGHRAP